MKRVLVAAMLLAGGLASYAQLDGTFAGMNDTGQAGAYFEAEIEQTGTHDPGHAYEDVDNDGRYTNGTDVAIEDHELADGRYAVQDDDHGLVIPRSVGTIEAPAGAIELASGARGHLVIEVKLEAADTVRLEAGTDADLTDVTVTAGTELRVHAGGDVDVGGANLEADEAAVVTAGGALSARKLTLESQAGARLTAAGGDAIVTAATLEAAHEMLIEADATLRVDESRIEAADGIVLDAGADVYSKRATLETDGDLLIEAGSAEAAIFVEGARFADANDTAHAAPDGVEIVGTPAEGSIDHTG